MKRFLPLLCLLALPWMAKAQAPADSIRRFSTDSNMIQDHRVNDLILKHVMINEAKKEKSKGYRVQIHSSPERAKALEAKTKFSSTYNTPAYLLVEMPYFKIRVGDFRTKLEAEKLKQEIIGSFPGSYIVVDDIELPKIDQ